MGWMFDLFLSEEKRIGKNQRTLTNRDKQAEDRETAARWLNDNGSPKGIVALLTRFDMNLENQLHDKDEKQLVYGMLASAGEAVTRPLDRHLKRCRQLAMPMRLHIELHGLDATVEKVMELLQIELEKDDFKPRKKHDMLVWLAEHKHPRVIEAVTPFLADFDENVRYSAAEVMLAQGDDAARPALAAALANPEEESNRLRVRLAEAFQQRGWSVDDPDAVAAHLSERFALRGGRVVLA